MPATMRLLGDGNWWWLVTLERVLPSGIASRPSAEAVEPKGYKETRPGRRSHDDFARSIGAGYVRVDLCRRDGLRVSRGATTFRAGSFPTATPLPGSYPFPRR